MKEIIAYEMKLNKSKVDTPNIACIPFQKQYFEEYMRIYNECFYEMRKTLDIEPYHFLHDYEQIADKIKELNLTLVPGETVSVPAIAQLPLTLECKVIYQQDQDLSALEPAYRAHSYPAGTAEKPMGHPCTMLFLGGAGNAITVQFFEPK